MNKKSIIFVIFLVLGLSLFATAGMRLEDSRDGTTRIRFELPEYQILQPDQLQDGAPSISAEGAQYIGLHGEPMLPVFSSTIGIGNTGELSWEIEVIRERVIDDITITPYTDPSSTGEEYSPEIYGRDVFWPVQSISIGEPAIMRDVRVAGIRVVPFLYNDATRRLRVIEEAVIEVRVDPTRAGVNEITTLDRPRSHSFDRVYRSSLINYDAIDFSGRDDFQRPCLVYIYNNSASSAPTYLQPLTTWRERVGYEVHVVSTSQTGTSATSIENWIQNAYNTWTNPPEFVCLVGDASGSYSIPTHYQSWSYYNAEGDHPYATTEGTDQIEDIFIGRFSYSSYTELQTMVSRTVMYEYSPDMTPTNWFEDNLLVGDTSPSGVSTTSTCKYAKEVMTAYNPGYNGGFTELYGASPSPSQMNSAINNGISYFVYRGWIGMSGWDTSDINSLTNSSQWPVCSIITCDTGSFASGTSRSEQMIRVGSSGSPKGGICAIGSATSGTHTAYNNCLTTGIFHGLFAEDMRTIGEALQHGKFNLWQVYENADYSAMLFFIHNNSLMGDPAVQVWKGIPVALSVSAPSTVAPGTDQVPVEVTSTGGQAISDAWVTIVHSNGTLVESGYTGQDGMIYLPFGSTSTGTVHLTVTKPGYQPSMSTFTVGSTAHSLIITEFSVDDDNSGTSSGNGDGAVNPGESIELGVRIANNGTVSQSSVIASISEVTNWTSVTDQTESYGTIASGSQNWSGDDFDFQVSDSCPGDTELIFDVSITSSGGQWTRRIEIPVTGAVPVVSGTAVQDGGNNVLDPGESASLILSLTNQGGMTMTGITAELTCPGGEIDVTTSTSSFGNMASGQTVNNSASPFAVTAEADIISGAQIPMILTLDFNGLTQSARFNLTVGSVSVTDPLGPDSHGYYIYDDGDQNYNLCPTYSWIEIDPAYGGSGTVLSLTDNGDNDDETVTVTLPTGFHFRFYDKMYTQLGICSNGWIAPGGSEQISFRNFRLPGPGGPSPMIAPFWDDLEQDGANICTYYDSGAHRYIIEWSRVNIYGSSSQDNTFQVILYDSAFYVTPTGDSEILFQYHTVHNTDSGNPDPGDGLYCTTGIEDATGLRGLEYTFNNTYPASCQTLGAGRALFITTRLPEIQAPPVADISAESFQFTLTPGNTSTQEFTISNNGEADLIYNINKMYDVRTPFATGRDAGGPDNFGHTWIDSNEPDGPSFNWIDITGSGTQVTFQTNDNGVSGISLPFDFPFYNGTYSQILINPNGWIGFGSDDNNWTNSDLPNAASPSPALFPLWDDLNPNNQTPSSDPAGDVWYDGNANRFIVTYDDVIHYTDSYGYFTFQVILYPNGKIRYQYNLTDDISSATIGFQDANGSDGLQIAYNGGYTIGNQQVIEIHPPYVDWLDVSPTSGIIQQGQTVTIGLDVSTSQLELGNYSCSLILATNDPNHLSEVLPVDLSVTESINPPAAVQNLQIVMNGNSAVLTWDEVSTDTEGNPITVDYYKLYGSNVGQPLDATPAYFLVNVSSTSFTMTNIGSYFDSFQILVTAVKDGREIPVTRSEMDFSQQTRKQVRKN